MQEYYILQQEDLMVLASLFGLEHIYGLAQKEKEEERMVPYRVHEMARNGVFCLQGEELFVQEPYKTILQSMKSATDILIVRKYEKGERYLWFYMGNPVVCLEESRTDDKAVKIRLLNKSELFQTLEEVGFFPEECLDRELASLEDIEEVRGSLEELPVCVRFRKVPAQFVQEEIKYELTLIRSRNNYWITGHDSVGKKLLFPYEKERLYDAIKKMLEENRE